MPFKCSIECAWPITFITSSHDPSKEMLAWAVGFAFDWEVWGQIRFNVREVVKAKVKLRAKVRDMVEADRRECESKSEREISKKEL
jgi:hypothetical protein